MPEPKRIQRKRTKGSRMPAGAVYVGRPTKWGNPFTLARDGVFDVVLADGGHGREQLWRVDVPQEYTHLVFLGGELELEHAADLAVGLYEDFIAQGLDISGLRGKDLACWCPLDQPCHADVLLELANRHRRARP